MKPCPTRHGSIELFELHIDDTAQPIRYTVIAVHEDGQRSLTGQRERGPFDTDLEVAQWAWRTLTRALSPRVS